MASRTSVLAGVEPSAFWAHFEKLTTIARPSREEEPVIDYVRAWGEERGYRVRQDEARNLMFDVPATEGRESAPMVVRAPWPAWSIGGCAKWQRPARSARSRRR